ncbi:glycosyltransferase family 4 protein [Aurantibacillus circumpalustris]|uniref:glycosyltransferase family 4 protein n=1 Tax=Aurantibacillus circumpalustris TaxID=3036359 RepID=UPI00295B073D|nr:glycosyltransferase [Aurantibacillus circumpalustris]
MEQIIPNSKQLHKSDLNFIHLYSFSKWGNKMPNVLILCAHRPKRSPSQRYRFEQYLPFLKQHGFNFTFSYLLNEKDDTTFYSQGNFLVKIFILIKSVLIRLKDCFRFKNFDIIFIQREASFLGTSYFEKRAHKSGAYVIFDFDDSIWLADTSPGNKKWEFIKKPEKFFRNISYANCVIAGNSYLAKKSQTINKNTKVIPTTIDTDFHMPKPKLRNNEIITIGWSGSISTVKHFETLLPVLMKIKLAYGNKVNFKVLGDPHYSSADLNVIPKAWTETTEVDELNSFDIGIMPLPDDAWANGKCGLKALSYMACEIAVVISAVGINKEIVEQDKNGFLASTEDEWFRCLSQLIDDKTIRNEMGKAGRKTVIERYSVEANKAKYLEIFNNGRMR